MCSLEMISFLCALETKGRMYCAEISQKIDLVEFGIASDFYTSDDVFGGLFKTCCSSLSVSVE